MKRTRSTESAAGGLAANAVADGRPKSTRVAKPKKPNLKTLCLLPERFDTANPERPGCVECALYKKAKGKARYSRPFVPRNWSRKLLVVTTTQETPSSDNGRLILRHARRAGLSAVDVAFASAVRCSPAKAVTKHAMKHLRGCRSFIVQAITVLKPAYVLAMGNDALRAVLNDGAPGKIISGRGVKRPIPGVVGAHAYVSFEPNTSPDLYPRVVEDFERISWPVTEWPKDEVPRASIIAVDSEFDPSARLLDVAIADDRNAACVPAEAINTVDGIKHALDDAEYLGGHSIMGDVDQLVKLGWAKEEWVDGSKTYDSLLLSRMTDENRGKGGYNVEALLLSKHNVEPWKFKTEEYDKADATTWPADLRAERCRLDAWGSRVVIDDHLKTAKGPIELTHRIGAALHRIRLAGAYVDLAEFGKISDATQLEVTSKRDLLVKSAQAVGMQEFAPTNDNHIRELLFDRLKLPPTEKTAKGQLKVDKLSLKAHVGNEVIKTLQAFNKADKLYTTYCEGIKSITSIERAPWGGDIGWFPVNINPLGARTGRRSSGSNEELGIDSTNSQNMPKSFRRIIRSRWKNGLIGDHDYCVDPKTRVLCADLVWRVAEDLSIGTEIVGFDEDGPHRKMRKAVVTSNDRIVRPTVRVITDRGNVVCSTEHRWLVRPQRSGCLEWKRADELVEGDSIAYYAAPWDVEHSHESGYLAGIFDGEGWCGEGGVGYGQKPGVVAEYVNDLLRRRGFDVRENVGKSGVGQYCINGGVGGMLRLLGSIRPKRLLSKAGALWEGRQAWGKWSRPAIVREVRAERTDGPVIALGTSTRTFIAEGFFSHNCRLEVILFGWHADEQDLIDFFYNGNGYIAVARELFKTDVKEGTDQYRATKSTVLGVQYNMQDWKLANQLWHVAGVKLSSDWDEHCELAAEIRAKYLARFPGIKRYIRARTDELLKTSQVKSRTGRVRHLPCPQGEETPHFWHLKNEAVNFPVQSFASDVTGSALVDIEAALCAEHRVSREEYHRALLERRWPEMAIIINEVHDDVVLDYFPDTFKRDQEIVVETMRAVPTLRKLCPSFTLPLKVGVEASALWCAGKG